MFELTNYHIELFRTREFESQTVGRLFLRAQPKAGEPMLELMGAGVGDGPVAALDAAIRNALSLRGQGQRQKGHFAFLEELSLVDYRVRVINPEAAASARVRVVISTQCERDSQTWDTVGVSENIVDASLEALKDSYEYFYNRFILNAAETSF